MIFLAVATLVGIANAAQQPRNPPQGWGGKDGAKAPLQKPPRGWEREAAYHALHSESAYHKLRLPEVLTPVELHHGYKKWKSTRRSLQEKPSQAESSDMPGVSGMPGVTGEINDGMPGATIMPGKTLPIKTRRRLADKDVINEAELTNELRNLVNEGKATTAYSTVGFNPKTGHIQVGLTDAAVGSIFDNTKEAIVSLGGNTKEVIVSLGDQFYKMQKCYWDDLKNSRSTELSKLELGKKYNLATLKTENQDYLQCMKGPGGLVDPTKYDVCKKLLAKRTRGFCGIGCQLRRLGKWGKDSQSTPTTRAHDHELKKQEMANSHETTTSTRNQDALFKCMQLNKQRSVEDTLKLCGHFMKGRRRLAGKSDKDGTFAADLAKAVARRRRRVARNKANGFKSPAGGSLKKRKNN